jgi:hypothetical protein
MGMRKMGSQAGEGILGNAKHQYSGMVLQYCGKSLVETEVGRD